MEFLTELVYKVNKKNMHSEVIYLACHLEVIVFMLLI